jgi:hypothetical protein
MRTIRPVCCICNSVWPGQLSTMQRHVTTARSSRANKHSRFVLWVRAFVSIIVWPFRNKGIQMGMGTIIIAADSGCDAMQCDAMRGRPDASATVYLSAAPFACLRSMSGDLLQ